jgi:hypothetical protein
MKQKIGPSLDKKISKVAIDDPLTCLALYIVVNEETQIGSHNK